MVNLYFQPHAQLTVQDRMVLDVLHKDYERFQKPAAADHEASDDSDDSTVKHTRFSSASPEGEPPLPTSRHSPPSYVVSRVPCAV